MNAHEVITEAVTSASGSGCSITGPAVAAASALNALRAAAGGADRVVLAWEPTPCATCRGDGHLGPATWAEQRDYGRECQACGGSGVDGYTVTLQTLAEQGSTCSCVVAPEQPDEPCAVVPLFRLVAVSPEPPKEPQP